MTKNLITINQFIQKSLGEWKSIRSTHSLAFQEVENSTSTIVIKELEINNKNVIDLLETYNPTSKTSFIALSISWRAISDWEIDQKVKEDKTILLFLPEYENRGIVLRNKGYTESLISSSEYLIDENEDLNIKTIYNSTISEERISFLSNHIRSRYSVIRNQENNTVIQTSHTSEIRNISILKD
ncbi:phycobiliprotein lyase [Prochlorococcus sp. AH-716-O05]|nr:phycobiliprotein lyase [Prochlorococcus sp. AH-716-O05]